MLQQRFSKVRAPSVPRAALLPWQRHSIQLARRRPAEDLETSGTRALLTGVPWPGRLLQLRLERLGGEG